MMDIGGVSAGSGSGSGITSLNSIPVTYAELIALVGSSTLKPEFVYQITDFATTHTIPTTAVLNTGINEPLLVKAKSTNQLYPEAASTLYLQDIIYYSITNSATAGSLKGFIYRRVDMQRKNDLPFDYRNVKFRRYKSDMTSVGLSNSYYLWATSVSIGYNVSANTSFTFAGNPADYTDVYALCNSATPDARGVLIDPFYTETGSTNWTPANYNFYINGTSCWNIKLTGYSFNFTLVSEGSIFDIVEGNIHSTVWYGNGSLGSQYIVPGIYNGVENSIIIYTNGGSCLWVYYNSLRDTYIKTNRFWESKIESCYKLSINLNWARNTTLRQISCLNIGTGSESISGINIETSGGNINSFNYGGLSITDFTGADLGIDNSTYLFNKGGYSNIPFTYVITGLTTLNFGGSTRYLAGIVRLSSTNSTENINAFSNVPLSQEFRIIPLTGLTLTITASATIKLGGLASITLNGTNGEYAVFRYISGVCQLSFCSSIASTSGYLPLAGGLMTGAIKGADIFTIASAATTDLSTAISNDIYVTGTTNISSFGTTPAGTKYFIRFAGSLTIINNGAQILPGNVNITTSANDYLILESLGAGNYRGLIYSRNTGKALVETVSADYWGYNYNDIYPLSEFNGVAIGHSGYNNDPRLWVRGGNSSAQHCALFESYNGVISLLAIKNDGRVIVGSGKLGAQVTPSTVLSMKASASTKALSVGGKAKEWYVSSVNIANTSSVLALYSQEANLYGANGDTAKLVFTVKIIASAIATKRLHIYFETVGNEIYDSTAQVYAADDLLVIEVYMIRETSTTIKCVTKVSNNTGVAITKTQYKLASALTFSNINTLSLVCESVGADSVNGDITLVSGYMDFKEVSQ